MHFVLQHTHCLKITLNVVFEFWHFPPIFVLLKLTCLVTLFDRMLQVLKNSLKCNIFGILPTQIFQTFKAPNSIKKCPKWHKMLT